MSIFIGYDTPVSAESVPLLSKSFLESPSPSLSTSKFSSILYCFILPEDCPANINIEFSRCDNSIIPFSFCFGRVVTFKFKGFTTRFSLFSSKTIVTDAFCSFPFSSLTVKIARDGIPVLIYNLLKYVPEIYDASFLLSISLSDSPSLSLSTKISDSNS